MPSARILRAVERLYHRQPDEGGIGERSGQDQGADGGNRPAGYFAHGAKEDEADAEHDPRHPHGIEQRGPQAQFMHIGECQCGQRHMDDHAVERRVRTLAGSRPVLRNNMPATRHATSRMKLFMAMPRARVTTTNERLCHRTAAMRHIACADTSAALL